MLSLQTCWFSERMYRIRRPFLRQQQLASMSRSHSRQAGAKEKSFILAFTYRDLIDTNTIHIIRGHAADKGLSAQQTARCDHTWAHNEKSEQPPDTLVELIIS
jgi:hypothetical protein